jgi:hypothetical protein
MRKARDIGYPYKVIKPCIIMGGPVLKAFYDLTIKFGLFLSFKGCCITINYALQLTITAETAMQKQLCFTDQWSVGQYICHM